MTDVEFAGRMRSMRAEDLIRIAEAYPDDGFEPEAIAAAQRELSSRNLSSEDYAEMQRDVDVEFREEGASAEKELSNKAFVFFLIVGPFFLFSLVAIIVLLALYTRGFKRMALQAFNASVVGVILWFMLFLGLMGLSWLFDF